jgi:hypothetical protein
MRDLALPLVLSGVNRVDSLMGDPATSEIVGQSYGIRVQTAISGIASRDDSTTGGKALQLQHEVNCPLENPVFIFSLD